jgi:hypothetical protein
MFIEIRSLGDQENMRTDIITSPLCIYFTYFVRRTCNISLYRTLLAMSKHLHLYIVHSLLWASISICISVIPCYEQASPSAYRSSLAMSKHLHLHIGHPLLWASISICISVIPCYEQASPSVYLSPLAMSKHLHLYIGHSLLWASISICISYTPGYEQASPSVYRTLLAMSKHLHRTDNISEDNITVWFSLHSRQTHRVIKSTDREYNEKRFVFC